MSKGGLLKLRAAVMRAVWSRKKPLASSGAVLGLLDGPHGCDPSFCIVWFRFRLFRRYLSFRPDVVPRLYTLLDLVRDGCPGHGLIHALVTRAPLLALASFFLELVVGHLGLLVLKMLLYVCLKVLWVLILLIFSRVGMSLRVLIGILLLIRCLLILMFGLMVSLFVMRFLVLLLLVLVFMLVCMLPLGDTGVGGQF